MEQAEFNQALEFDKNDSFATRLFAFFATDKRSGTLSMDEFVVGVAKVAPGMLFLVNMR